MQSSLLYYFLHTREESFFAAIRNRMHLSALAIKERSEFLWFATDVFSLLTVPNIITRDALVFLLFKCFVLRQV